MDRYELSEEDAGEVAKLAAVIHQTGVHQPLEPTPSPAVTPSENTLRARAVLFALLRTRVEDILAARYQAVISAIDGAALTQAVKGVIEFAPDALTDLWQLDSGGGHFRARLDGHLYSISVLTGVVLYDGTPPQSLSAEILHHALYKRVFGDRDFEVRASVCQRHMLHRACHVNPWG